MDYMLTTSFTTECNSIGFNLRISPLPSIMIRYRPTGSSFWTVMTAGTTKYKSPDIQALLGLAASYKPIQITIGQLEEKSNR